MIKVFTAYQYLEMEGIDTEDEQIIDIIDNIISLEIAIFHMRNTRQSKYYDGYNIDILRNLRGSYITILKEQLGLNYVNYNDFE